jgi:hypothetical protein
MPDDVCAATGKNSYPSKSAASQARARLRKTRTRDRSGEMQIFRCGACELFHVGHLMRGRKGGQGIR